MNRQWAWAELAGRVLLAHMFLISGLDKIGDYGATVQYMGSAGVPGALLPLVIATEVLGGALLLIGWQTRWTALVLACFTGLAAIFFHTQFEDPMQWINWMKNWTIVGGMLVAAAHAPGRFSIDARHVRHKH